MTILRVGIKSLNLPGARCSAKLLVRNAREDYREQRTISRLARDLDLAVVCFYHRLDETQAQAETFL